VSQVPVPGELADTEPAFSWSSDGRLLSLTYIASDVPESQLRGERSSVAVFDLKTRRFHALAKASPGTYYSGGEWIPGTHNLILRRVIESDPWVSDAFPDWTVTSALSGALPAEARWRPIELYPRGLRFVPVRSNRLLLANTHNAVHSLFEVTQEGVSPAELMSGVDGSSSSFQFGKDFRSVVFVNESLTRPPEIYARVRGTALRKLTSLNDDIARKIQYRSREVAWQSTDGVTIKGWLLEPTPTRGAVPLITFVHGGPAFAFPNAYAPYLAMWPYPLELFASRGTAVFIPNYRGTHTFGRAIASGSDAQAVNDIVTGIQSLIASGVADERRLGVCGHSHGAMLGPRVMVAAKNFRASSFAEGVASSVVMYELMSGQANREIHDAIIGASLYDSPERYIDDSPNLQFTGLETASLFEAGAYTAGLLMLGFPKAAARAGMPTEFVVYPRTGHNLAIPSLMRESARRNLAWFELWLSEHPNPQ
jgi:dipeptidyl aminopeptidase/acylaminoacyl peptidase